MKNKGTILCLTVLTGLSLTAGIIGYTYSTNELEEEKIIDNTSKITYVYYLDGNEVKKEDLDNHELVYDKLSSTSTIENTQKYIFSNYSCTNNLNGTFNVNTWEFIPNENKMSTCKLYFNKAYYDATLTITNGELLPTSQTKIKREQNGTFEIKPNDGYEFSDVVCSNNKEATWDSDNNSLLINAITEDVACMVNFKLKKLAFSVKVQNGTGENIVNTTYGEKVTSIVAPSIGYEFNENKSTITCTNNQKAKYSNNEIIIDKITDNTECTISFSQTKLETFNVSLTLPTHIKVLKGGTSQEVTKNSSIEFTLNADEGYSIDKMDCDGTEPAKTTNADGSITYKLYNVDKNTTCTVSEKINQ